MRLGNFRLERYGPFECLDLPFDPAPGTVNLIVAPNGYGKSVIRRAIGEFLFGIEARTPMTFRFGTEKMRLLAEITHDGGAHSLVRRKGNGITLAQADGTEIHPEQARRLLGGADEMVFRELFGLDTALLRSGGQSLIRSQGRLGQVLFAAGGGMARVRELLSELERRRDDLGKASARHKSRPLWSAMSSWEQAGADLRKASLRPDGWQALERQAAETARDLDGLLHDQANEACERERRQTIRACRPWLDRLRSAESVLAEANGVPDLDDGFERRWRDALQHNVVCAGKAGAALADLQAANDARASLGFDPAWIAAEAEIAALADLRGVVAQCEIDLPSVEREQGGERVRAVSLRRDLGWDASVPLPPAPAVKDAQRRLRQHPKLAADAAAAEDARAAADRALSATLAELAGLPSQGDVAAIADLVGLLRGGGDPAIRLEAARRKSRDGQVALQAALSAIPDSPLPEAALATTAAPSEARLDAVAKALNDAETAHAQALRDQAARAADIGAEQARLTALEHSAMLPPQDALSCARALRDALWGGICGPGRPEAGLAIQFDRALRDADRIADALIAHGQEVAEAAALRSHLASLRSDQATQAEIVAQTASSLAQVRDGLSAIARAAGGRAQDVPALRSFLRAREAAVTARSARDATDQDLAELEATLTTLSGRLAAGMDTVPGGPVELGALLAKADRRIEADRNLAAQRKLLTEQAGKLRVAQATAGTGSAKAARLLADWQGAWQAAAAALARPATEAPGTTEDAIGHIENLRKTEAAIVDMQIRIDRMRDARSLLATRVACLEHLSPAFAALPPIQAAEAFRQRVQAEQREAARCSDADRRIEQARQKRALAMAEAEQATGTLNGLRAALRADTSEEAEQQLQRARAVASARGDKAEALRHLAEQGGGLPVDAISARAAETTADADAARIAEIDADHQQRQRLIEAARIAAAAAAAALDNAGNGLDAAEAAQRREAAQAMLSRTAEEALVLHAAHALLQAALDRQSANADQPLLARIGAVFRTITGGAQAGVRVEDTRDGQTMVALEADGLTRKTLDHLSEGTSDQLYLALRIAALEDYAATASPLPFIADDLLQTFDDPRTAATMRVLQELSARVQVIVLTHHTHVGDLAAGLADAPVNVIRLAA
jgi:uncharacterized protein YhaN